MVGRAEFNFPDFKKTEPPIVSSTSKGDYEIQGAEFDLSAVWERIASFAISQLNNIKNLADAFQTTSKKLTPGWPRFWEMGQYLLPKKTRERVYTPAHQELTEDYIKTRKIRSKWARRWLNLCFTFRTLLLITDCWRALLTDKSFQMLLKLVPVPFREWWSRPRF
ncbi:hypothetical protein [Gimesia sp.]|uniref:hypothetical protein n=1 Tax=Gimesia sp. TaxID=2024833 RepID=UPI003A8D1747